MRTLTLLTLAASAAIIPGAALAQPAAGARAGVTWQGGGMHRGGHVRPHVRPGHVTPPPHVRPRPHVRPGRGQWGGHRWQGRFRPGPGFSRRIVRGGFVHPYWFGNQFHINNWQTYGFANPGEDRRWVRYYDDAYLIDRGGRVVDSREGLDWDQYGERWEVEDGVPSYYGSRDWTPGDEDYDYAESRRDLDEDYAEERGGHRRVERHHGGGGHHGGGHASGGWDYSAYGAAGGGAYGHGGAGGSVTRVYGGGPGYGPGPAPGAVYGGGYGYGYYAYPIIIETTTTHAAAATTYSEEIIEEVIETRRPRRRVRRPCNCAPRPRPPAGERG